MLKHQNMDTREIIEQIDKEIGPKLQELGIEAFVMTAYVVTGDGHVDKIQLNAMGRNPAYADGLRPMFNASLQWAQGTLR